MLFYQTKQNFHALKLSLQVILIMISILIPNYGQNIKNLVEALLVQVKQVSFPVEIWVGDDGSEEVVFMENLKMQQPPAVRFIRQKKSVGRSVIRNLLAENAEYPYLLFIDSDAEVLGSSFLKNYFEKLNTSNVIVGGTAYQEGPPTESGQVLRWKYGKKREERPASVRSLRPWASFSSFNFLIEKSLFQRIRFDEEIADYGHEDTYLGYQMKKNNISIDHIDNPLIHTGLDDAAHFLEKTRRGVEGLWKLYEKTGNDPEFSGENPLLRSMDRILKLRMKGILGLKFKLFRKHLENNLLGKNPSVSLFQIYKLGYLCTLAEK